MKKLSSVIASAFAAVAISFSGNAQTIDTQALAGFAPSTIRETFEVCKHAHLSAAQQQSLAKAIEKENKQFVKMIADGNGMLSVKDRNKLSKMREKTLRELLDDETLTQYYRGVYDNEAKAEGAAMADKLQQKYDLTDQNWKFINIAFYKIALDTRVISKMMADTPQKAKKEIQKMRKQQMLSIEEKGGIRVNPDEMTVEVIRPFNPTALRKE